MRDLITMPWFSITGWILTALGTILTVVLYYRGRAIIAPVFHRRSSVIFDKARRLKDIEIRFRGQIVDENIHYILVTFWNRGRKPIEPSDLVSKDPVRLIAENCRILDASIRREVNTNNNFRLSKAENESFHLLFDYIGRSEGVAIGVVVASTLEPREKELLATWNERVSQQIRISGSMKSALLLEYKKDRDLLTKRVTQALATITGMNYKKAPLVLRILSTMLLVVLVCLLVPLLLVITFLDVMRNSLVGAADTAFV